MEHRQDITSEAPFIFKEMLKMKRREMGPGARKRTKSPKIRILWLYPYAQERQYRKYVFELMDVYSDMALPRLRSNMPRWIESQKEDAWSDERKQFEAQLKTLKEKKRKWLSQRVRSDAEFEIKWSIELNRLDEKIDNTQNEILKIDDFNTEFQQLINQMHQTQRDMFDEDGKGVEDDKGNFYNWLAIGASLKAVGFSVSKFNQKQEDKITKRILGQPFIPAEPWLEDVIKLWSNENYGLIKSLSDDYIKKLNFIVNEGIANNESMQAIMKKVRSMDKNITRTRARLLTRDQVGKLNGRLTKKRSQEAGLDLYRWSTAQDERVRTNHKVLNGKICKWGDSSVYADTVAEAKAGNWKSRSSINGYVGIPGQDVQCRCASIPVVDDIIDEVDSEIEKEAA